MVTELETGDVPDSAFDPVAMTRNTVAPAASPDRVWVMLPPTTAALATVAGLQGPADVAAFSSVLTTPIMMPIIMELGFNPIHYAAVIGVNTALGCITPPAAPVLYLSGRLSKTPINEMMTPALYFMLLCWGPVLIFTSYFPKLVLFLPHVILGTPW